MNIEEIALRLIESDCNVDIYFGILDKLEKHTTKIQELENEKAHIEIAYEEDYEEQQQEIERLNNIINRTTKYVQSLSSKGRSCDIYEDIKQEILKELKGSDSNE